MTIIRNRPVAIVVAACMLAWGGAGAVAAEPVDPALILATMRESFAAKGALAERVRVTIKPLGKQGKSDEFLIRVDPGKKADGADASLWIELGDLRIFAGDGRLVAVHTGDMTSCYTVEYGGPLRADTLRALLPPIPAPLLALILPDKDPEEGTPVSVGLTPYTPRVTWTSAEASLVVSQETVLLTGTRDAFPGERPQPDDVRVTMLIDARSSRPTRFTAMLPDASELRLDLTPVVPGNPATWPIRFAERSRVAALTDLHERRGDAAAANVVPEMGLIDAGWNAWDHRSVFQRPASAAAPLPTHLVLLFVRENQKDAFGVPSADAKAAEEELRRIEAELNGARPGGSGGVAEESALPRARVVHYVVPVMLTMDDTSRRKVETAVRLREGAGVAGNLIWSPTPERTIERFAPGAAAIAVVIRADNSLGGIILLDGRAREGAGIRAGLLEAITPQAAAPK